MDMLFLLVVALMFVHELDAILQREYRFFFAFLDDVTAYRVFTAAHIPLFIWVMANLNAPLFQIGFSAFAILHAGLHWFLRKHPLIEFRNTFSRVIIYGAAASGIASLLALASG